MSLLLIVLVLQRLEALHTLAIRQVYVKTSGIDAHLPTKNGIQIFKGLQTMIKLY